MRVTEIVALEQVKKKYYVYLFWYPEDYQDENGSTELAGIVFYVGKGSINAAGIDRIDQHEKEARLGYAARRYDVIRKIWRLGYQVQKAKVYETDVERDALIYEWACIQCIYAGPYLANVTGNSYYYDEMRENYERRQAQWAEEREREARSQLERTYIISPESQEILLQFAQEDRVTPLECLEQMIKACSVAVRKAS